MTSQHVIIADGLSDYAEFRNESYRDLNHERHLVEAKRLSRWGYLFGRPMPMWFYDTVRTIGFQLDALVDWDIVCQLVSCDSWETWMQLVPVEQRERVRELLAVKAE